MKPNYQNRKFRLDCRQRKSFFERWINKTVLHVAHKYRNFQWYKTNLSYFQPTRKILKLYWKCQLWYKRKWKYIETLTNILNQYVFCQHCWLIISSFVRNNAKAIVTAVTPWQAKILNWISFFTFWGIGECFSRHLSGKLVTKKHFLLKSCWDM